MIGNRRGSRLRLMVGIPLALSFVIAACGSDSDSGDSATDDSTESADSAESGSSGDVTEIRWFVGLGTGAEAEQIDRQEEFVAKFNESQSEIKLVAEYVDNDLAKDQLATQIAAGNAPDIVGPVGLEGSNAFAGQYLDLEPLIESSGFDLTPYGEEAVEVWREESGELTGLPFASYPSAMFYNKELFDEAGLPYPPAEYGPDGISTYGEGTEYEGEWNWDKVTELAMILSVDANGNDANSPDYDKEDIVQFGYVHQWSDMPAHQGTLFGAGHIEQEDGTAKVPEQWVDEWKWYHDLVIEKGAAPSNGYMESDAMAGNAFNSGRVAMANTHLWYTCCLFDEDGNARTNWDLAAVPNYNGMIVSRFHGDNFRILKDTKHPEEAFTVLSYMLNEGALDLLTVYGAMPARDDIREAYFANLDESFTQGVNWDVIIAGLEWPDVPNHQANMTKFLESDARIKELQIPLITDSGIDIDAEVVKLEADLEKLWGS